MSQRWSEYQRRERDYYSTPAWVTELLLPHIPKRIYYILEPAAGDGKMATVLDNADINAVVIERDIKDGFDFLKIKSCNCDAIITNPPYGLAQEFIEKALELTQPESGFVAMLLRSDYDSAATRKHLFADCKIFSKKITLTKRIVWFKRTDGKKEAPSENHAWYLFDWLHKGPPTIEYAP